MLADGNTVAEDGTIVAASGQTVAEALPQPNDNGTTNVQGNAPGGGIGIIPIVVIVVLVVFVLIIIMRKAARKKKGAPLLDDRESIDPNGPSEV